MKWSHKWRKELESGQYYDLLKRGFLKKQEDLEPSVEGFDFYLDAFRELSTARPQGFSVGAIPFTAIAEYFTIYDIDGDFDEFASIIRRMDIAYLDLEAEEMKASQKGSKGGGTNSNAKNPNQG